MKIFLEIEKQYKAGNNIISGARFKERNDIKLLNVLDLRKIFENIYVT